MLHGEFELPHLPHCIPLVSIIAECVKKAGSLPLMYGLAISVLVTQEARYLNVIQCAILDTHTKSLMIAWNLHC